jgi:hypothetical protein
MQIGKDIIQTLYGGEKSHCGPPRFDTVKFVDGYQYTLSIFRVCSLTTLRHNSEEYIMETYFFLICIVGGGIKVHSTLRPLNGLLCQHRVIMIMEKSVE